MTDTNSSWRDGDVYFWQWKNPPDHMPYHCCACKAIVRGARLVDLYWSTPSDGRVWTQEQALERLNLDYQGNLDELEPVGKEEAAYYERKDIVNLTHPNSFGNKFHRRKGSVRSKERMLERLHYLRGDAESDIRVANSRLERLKEAEIKILAGNDLEKVYL